MTHREGRVTTPRVVAVVGPTASGKTDVALDLAERLDGEIVSCDSVQVYRGMDVGSAKPSPEEQARVPHHLIDVVDPDEDFSAARFAALADEAAAAIAGRGRAVVLCGGTGLYLRAWLWGLFPAPPADAAIRARHRAVGEASLRARLGVVDPEACDRIAAGDVVRLSRALEVYEQTGVPLTELWRRSPRSRRYPARIIGLAPPREALNLRIDSRFDAMMAAGLLGEVRGLMSRYGADLRPLGALGYRQLREHLLGRVTLPEAVALAKRDTRRFAKRQLTWFRKEPGVEWHAEPGGVDVTGLRRFLEGEDQHG